LEFLMAYYTRTQTYPRDRIPLKTVRLIKELKELNWFDDIRNDTDATYFYFPPNENDAVYGIKISNDGRVTAVFYAVKFWDMEIDFEELLESVSEEVSNTLIYNLDIFRRITS
jgi:hypothetical protein